jgi:cell wall-associated NlpC family hydrolase
MASRLARLVVVLAACTAAACATGRAVPRPFPRASLPPTAPEIPPPAEGETPPATVTDETAAPGPILATALSFRGTPYRFGGSDPSGFDCSGFVQYVFARHGTVLPREVRDQFRAGEPISLDEVRPGDLVFFETVSRGASHVGIALEHDQFVHAPSSRGVVRVERYTGAYWGARFVGARRITPESGAVASSGAGRGPGRSR